MPNTASACLHCGAQSDALIAGAGGSICRPCVWRLAARLSEEAATAAAPAQTEEFSAHDYQSRIDLANAYLELGRQAAARDTLVGAAEAALLCADHEAALTSLARLLVLDGSPSRREQVCDMLTRFADSLSAPDDPGSQG